MGAGSPLRSSSGTTLYSQLASVLRGRIARGEWPVGHEIPRLEDLCKQYGVARISARQAIQMLVTEGLLSAHRGRRTVVINNGLYERTLSTGVAAPLEQVPGFSSRILHKSEHTSLPSFAAGLGHPEAAYMHIRKIDQERDRPYAVSDIYVAKSVYKRFPRNAEGYVKISRLVREALTAPLVSAREKIMVAAANTDEATALKCPISAPVAVVQRVYTDGEGRIVYAGWSVYRGDRFLVERELLELVHGDLHNPKRFPSDSAAAADLASRSDPKAHQPKRPTRET